MAAQDGKTYNIETIEAYRDREVVIDGKVVVQREYYVKWANYDASENTWEPIESFDENSAIEDFWRKQNIPEPPVGSGEILKREKKKKRKRPPSEAPPIKTEDSTIDPSAAVNRSSSNTVEPERPPKKPKQSEMSPEAAEEMLAKAKRPARRQEMSTADAQQMLANRPRNPSNLRPSSSNTQQSPTQERDQTMDTSFVDTTATSAAEVSHNISQIDDDQVERLLRQHMSQRRKTSSTPAQGVTPQTSSSTTADEILAAKKRPTLNPLQTSTNNPAPKQLASAPPLGKSAREHHLPSNRREISPALVRSRADEEQPQDALFDDINKSPSRIRKISLESFGLNKHTVGEANTYITLKYANTNIGTLSDAQKLECIQQIFQSSVGLTPQKDFMKDDVDAWKSVIRPHIKSFILKPVELTERGYTKEMRTKNLQLSTMEATALQHLLNGQHSDIVTDCDSLVDVVYIHALDIKRAMNLDSLHQLRYKRPKPPQFILFGTGWGYKDAFKRLWWLGAAATITPAALAEDPTLLADYKLETSSPWLTLFLHPHFAHNAFNLTDLSKSASHSIRAVALGFASTYHTIRPLTSTTRDPDDWCPSFPSVADSLSTLDEIEFWATAAGDSASSPPTIAGLIDMTSGYAKEDTRVRQWYVIGTNEEIKSVEDRQCVDLVTPAEFRSKFDRSKQRR